MRPKYTEAKSLMSLITLCVNLAITVILSLLVGFGKMPMPEENDLTNAIVGGATALVGFMIAVFTMYFTYKMPERIEESLKRHGYYYQVPRNMIHSMLFLAVSIFTAIASYFLQNTARNIFVVVSAVQFVAGIVLAVFVTARFFMLIKSA